MPPVKRAKRLSIVSFVVFSSVVPAFCLEVGAADSTWGDVSGRFVLAGDVVSTHKHAITVNPENRGLANVVVRLHGRRGVAVHPSYEKTANDDVVVSIRDRQYSRRIVAVRTSQRLVLRNTDKSPCNPILNLLRNHPKNPLLGPNSEVALRFTESERGPIPLTASIAASLRAYVVITDHPYVAISDASGNFKIAQVPTGSWTFQAWHEAAGWIRSVTRQGIRNEWEKGKFTIDLKGNGNDVGVIALRPELFRR